MSSKEEILASIRKNTKNRYEYPDWQIKTTTYPDVVAKFCEMSFAVGGEAIAVDRITYACFQAVFLVRQSLITDRTIKVSIIVQQISTHLGTYLRINSRNEYGRIGGKSIKEPAPESFLIMNQTVVSPHFKRDRNESQHLCTGSLFERSIQFCQGIVRQRCLRTVFNNSFRSGIKHFSFGQMFGKK